MGQVQQVFQLDLGGGDRCAGGTAHRQNFGAKADNHPGAGGGQGQLPDIAQLPPGRQIDPVLAQGEILNPVGDAIGTEHENICPRPAGQQIIARPIHQDIGPRRPRQPVIARPAHENIVARRAGQGFPRKGGLLGDPGRTGIEMQHGDAGFTAAGGKNIKPGPLHINGQGTDVVDPHRGRISHMCPRDQPPAGQQLQNADPVIRPADTDIGLPVQTGRGHRRDPGKAAAQIVDHMVGDPQPPGRQHLHHAERARPGGGQQQIGPAPDFSHLQGGRGGNPQPVCGIQTGAGGQGPIPCGPHRPAGYPRIGRAGGKQILHPPQICLRQSGDLIGMHPGPIRRQGSAGQLALRIKQHPAQPGLPGNPAINHLGSRSRPRSRPRPQRQGQRVNQIAAKAGKSACAQPLGRPKTAIPPQLAQRQRAPIATAGQQAQPGGPLHKPQACHRPGRIGALIGGTVGKAEPACRHRPGADRPIKPGGRIQHAGPARHGCAQVQRRDLRHLGCANKGLTGHKGQGWHGNQSLRPDIATGALCCRWHYRVDLHCKTGSVRG